MAIYHFSAKVIGRSNGRSAVASAAYRAAELLVDEKLGLTYDYTAKQGVVHSEIMLPEGAPERWRDRAVLWNEVEARELRRDAQLARDIEIALPRELGRTEAIRLAQDFVREQFVSRGMVADLNVHWTTARDGGEQPHAHIMLTMRRIEPVAASQVPQLQRERAHDRDGQEVGGLRHPRRGARRAAVVRRDPADDAHAQRRSDRRDPGLAADAGASAAEHPDPARGDRAPDRVARLIAAARLRAGLARQVEMPVPDQVDGIAADHAEAMRAGRLVAAARLRAGLVLRPEVIPAPAPVMGFGPKEIAWNDRALLRAWRERWGTMANERLAELGHEVTIDHRSYAAQGIALEPQHKIGPRGTHRDPERVLERAAEHMAIARRNGEAIIADPVIALDALTRQHSTFTRRDLARFVDRHTADADQFVLAMAKVEAAPELVRLGQDGRGRERLTTQAMLEAEQRMEHAGATLAERAWHRVDSVYMLTAKVRSEQAGLVLGAEQEAALAHVTGASGLSLVVGYAGTGKSAMLGVARTAWARSGYRVQGATLSGIAAEGLEAGSGIASRTLASLEFAWGEGRDLLTRQDVLVVDEAGLVGSRQMERVLSAARKAGAKVVLVGDPEQLQAIEAGAAFRALAERHGAAELTVVRRQREAWQRDATRALATGRTDAALEQYGAAGMVQAAGTREQARAALVKGWAKVRQASPQVSQVMLAYTRDDVRALNELARGRMRAEGALHGADQVVATERGKRALAAGDRVMFGRNERGLGADRQGRGGVAVKNGTLGTVLAVEAGGERLTVLLDGGQGVTFSLRDYAHIDHGYAATVHKAQGVTVDRAHVLATPHMDRHAAYVGLTRHRDGVVLHYAREDFEDSARLAVVLSRERAKDTSLDYDGRHVGSNWPSPADRAAQAEARLLRYAERRELDPLRPQSEIVVRAEMPAHTLADVPTTGPASGQAKAPAADPVVAPVQKQSRLAGPLLDAHPPVEPPVPASSPMSTGVSEPSTPEAGLGQVVTAGRAGFRARFEAHKAQAQAQARDEAAARELVGTWDRLRDHYAAAIPAIEADPALGGARDALLHFARGLAQQPGAVRVLREQGAAFGMEKRANLGWVVADPAPEQAMLGLLISAEAEMRARLAERQRIAEEATAQEAAAREAAAREAAAREAERLRQAQAPRPSRGPSMGM